MNKVRSLYHYFFTRLSFYPLLSGYAMASLFSFLSRQTFIMSNQGYAPLGTISMTVWGLTLLGVSLISFLAPKPFWPLICWLAWFSYAIPTLSANSLNIWMLTGALFLMVMRELQTVHRHDILSVKWNLIRTGGSRHEKSAFHFHYRAHAGCNASGLRDRKHPCEHTRSRRLYGHRCILE